MGRMQPVRLLDPLETGVSVISADNLVKIALFGSGSQSIRAEMNSRSNERKVSRLLADGYSQRILSYTYKKPMSAQKLSKICRIPIAACYRRIHELEQVGLISIADEKEIYKGRKVKLYRCRLKSASLRFSGGKFKVAYDTLPEEPQEGNGGESESNADEGVKEITAPITEN